MRLHIEKPIYGGAGLARHEGKAIFVERALPGEIVDAEILRSKASYAEARIQALVEPSPERTAPSCQHYGACGGCHYQHASRALELAMKKTILAETLTRARIAEFPEIQTLTAEPTGYRNRIRLHLRSKPFAVGYLKEQSHTLLAIEECTVAAPNLVEALRALASQAEAELTGWASEVELFTEDAAQQILLSVYAPAKTKQLEQRLTRLWQKLQTILPSVIGCTVFAEPEGRDFARPIATVGEASLHYHVGDHTYRVSAGSFFQVNRFLLAPMLTTVCAEHRGTTAWDLYAGVGLFTQPLAERFEQVVAVEAAAGSVRDLRNNVPQAKITAATTLDFLRRATRNRMEPETKTDLIVVDPPRAGLGQEAARLLAQIAAPNITYVSCDPTTLSRDLFELLQSGYRIQSLTLMDLFPETFHMETVVQLSRL